MEYLLKVPGNSSERRDEFDTEIDTAEREKEEPKSQNKLKSESCGTNIADLGEIPFHLKYPLGFLENRKQH